MKRLDGLYDKLKHFDETVPEEMVQNMPTYRHMFCNVLGGAKPANGDEALALFALGLKIRGTVTSFVDLENSEFKLLEGKVAENHLGWVAHFLAQVMLKLKEAKELE